VFAVSQMHRKTVIGIRKLPCVLEQKSHNGEGGQGRMLGKLYLKYWPYINL